MSSKNTQFGFKWDEEGIRLVVQRSFNDAKHMVLSVYTDKGQLQISVTPTGEVKTGWVSASRHAKPRIDPEYLKEVMEQ